MFDKLIIYLTEKKLSMENKKEELGNVIDDASWFFYEKKSDIKGFYNKNIKNTIDKIIDYFEKLYDDFYNAQEILYNFIWYRSDGRILGYIMSVIITLVLLLLTDIMVMIAGIPPVTLLLSLIPVSLIPIDIITTIIIFISKRFNRLYNNKLNKMKKEYGVKNTKELVEKYKAQKSQEQVKKHTIQKEIKIQDQKEVKKEISISKNAELTDSTFLEQMLGYVSYSRYVREEDRKNFLDEINNILNKYAQLKKDNQNIQVNRYLRNDVEHLQNEYSRYISNQEKKNNNEDGYSMGLRK